MNQKAKCAKCNNDLQMAASGYIRSVIKHDGTQGYMIMGQPDGREEFLICSHMKCNTRYEVRRMNNGKLVRGPMIEGDQ